jgi:hypothetical protein
MSNAPTCGKLLSEEAAAAAVTFTSGITVRVTVKPAFSAGFKVLDVVLRPVQSGEFSRCTIPALFGCVPVLFMQQDFRQMNSTKNCNHNQESNFPLHVAGLPLG